MENLFSNWFLGHFSKISGLIGVVPCFHHTMFFYWKLNFIGGLSELMLLTKIFRFWNWYHGTVWNCYFSRTVTQLLVQNERFYCFFFFFGKTGGLPYSHSFKVWKFWIFNRIVSIFRCHISVELRSWSKRHFKITISHLFFEIYYGKICLKRES